MCILHSPLGRSYIEIKLNNYALKVFCLIVWKSSVKLNWFGFGIVVRFFLQLTPSSVSVQQIMISVSIVYRYWLYRPSLSFYNWGIVQNCSNITWKKVCSNSQKLLVFDIKKVIVKKQTHICSWWFILDWKKTLKVC